MKNGIGVKKRKGMKTDDREVGKGSSERLKMIKGGNREGKIEVHRFDFKESK